MSTVLSPGKLRMTARRGPNDQVSGANQEWGVVASRRRTELWAKPLMRVSVLLLLGLGLLAACTSGSESPSSSSTTVPEQESAATTLPATGAVEPILVVGPAGDGPDAGAIGRVLESFGEQTGIEIRYVTVDEVPREFSRRVSRDEPGDIFLLDSVEVLVDAAVRREIRPIPREVDSAIGRSWSAAWTSGVRVGELLFGAPIEARTESMLWYQPVRISAAGYDTPSTWDELVGVAEEMIADGLVPFCGFDDELEQSRAFVDWAFDLLLRSHDPTVYDQIFADGGELNDPDVIEVWRQVAELWLTEGAGFGADGSLIGAEPDASTNAGAVDVAGADADSDVDAVLSEETVTDFVDGGCFFIRGGIEVPQAFPSGTRFADGTPGAVDVVVFPGPRGNIPLLADVTYAVSRRDTDDVWAVMRYLGGSEFARDRRAAQTAGAASSPAFLSAAADQDLFQLSLLELSLVDLMTRATEVREGWDELVSTFERVGLSSQAGAILSGETTAGDALEHVASR